MDQAFVLHRRRFRETSLIVEFLSLAHGRVAAVARGALRRRAGLAAVLQPLVRLDVEMRGRGELLTLVKAEPSGPAPALAGERLYSMLYVNELVVRLTAAHDPHPALFALYADTLAALAGAAPLEISLRRFERDLLADIGLGLNLRHEVDSGQPIRPDEDYVYVVDHGPRERRTGDAAGCRVRGATLLALAGEAPWQDAVATEAKRLMRY